MSSTVTQQTESMTLFQRHASLGLFSLVLTLLAIEPIRRFIALSFGGDEYSSHSSYILLIPFISAALIFFRREKIFSIVRTSHLWPLAAFSIAALAYAAGRTYGAHFGENDNVSLMTFEIIVLWLGGFLLIYGGTAFRAALFPLLFLGLAVPIPTRLIQGMVHVLQRGSADLVGVLFMLTGTPAFRNDMVFTLPGLAIQVAEACSGIRSTLGMFIVTLLASHLLLRSNWKKTALLMAVFPVSLFKNAVRIVTLSLLAIHYDMGFIKGSLHHDGGIVFMLGGLLLMYPLLSILIKSEEKKYFRTGVGS